METGHDSVGIGGSFAGQQVGGGSGIPLELVDAENAAGSATTNRQNVSTGGGDESMEVDTSTTAGGGGEGSGSAETVAAATQQQQPPSSLAENAAAAIGGMGGGGGGLMAAAAGTTPSDQLSLASGMEVSVGVGGGEKQVSGAAATNNDGAGGAQQPQVRDVAAQSALEQFQQEVARSLGATSTPGSSGGLEVAPDSIVFQPPAAGGGTPQHGGGAGGDAGGAGHNIVPTEATTPDLMNAAKRLLGGVNVSYGDLDISGMNSSMDQSLEVSTLSTPKTSRVGGNGATGNLSGVLNDPGSPSSVDSNFDSSELLNAEELQHDEMTSRLSRAGPIGLAAAAAIMTGRKRKRQHIFESNPALRKRHCSKLVRKLKDTVVELTARVGLQAAVVFYRPGKTEPKEEPSYKVFGASPLDSCLVNQKTQICSEMEAVLNQQMPLPAKEPVLQNANSEQLHELPPVLFDGIPTPVHKMTQAQLRAFIPNMLKYSTGRGKPGWGKPDMKPEWWPEDIPWQNVRSDMRTAEKKKEVPWTEGLRRIVISCYLHHGRLDLLPEFSLEHLPPISTETAQQIQLQLERLQQQHTGGGGEGGGGGGGVGVETVGGTIGTGGSGGEQAMEQGGGGVGVGGGGVGVANTGGAASQSAGGEVFTVDTGLGNCDNSGMPTLADATLAEAAAKLQQVADETGEVQYATHLVTVTEKDAKALGQPVGSTTTVLLTAYPGGHSGGVDSGAETSEQLISPPTSTNNVPNVQVVYSASQIDNIPDTLVSSVAASSSSTAVQLTQSSSTPVGSISIPQVIDASSVGVAGGGAMVGTGGSTTSGGVGVVGGGGGEGVMQTTSILGQSEVVTQIQGAMAEMVQQSQLMAAATANSGTAGTSSTIQDAIIGQGGVVGGDTIQDSIQDTIMGGGGDDAAAAAAILVASQVADKAATDSNQYLNPTTGGGMITGGGGGGTGGGGGGDTGVQGAGGGGGDGPTSVSDIASQLINQFAQAPFQQAAAAVGGGAEQTTVESMQADIVPQPAETTIPPSVST